MSKNQLIYLASPYSHPDAAKREERYNLAMAAQALLLQDGYVVYSPIVASHPLSLRYKLPGDYEFWKAQAEMIIPRCDILVVLDIDGWKESKSISAEIDIALRHDLAYELYHG